MDNVAIFIRIIPYLYGFAKIKDLFQIRAKRAVASGRSARERCYAVCQLRALGFFFFLGKDRYPVGFLVTFLIMFLVTVMRLQVVCVLKQIFGMLSLTKI